MKESDKTVRLLSVFLFVTGMALALLITIFTLWPDIEAAMFDVNNARGESLNSLRCPWLITPSDEAAIRLRLRNSLDRPVNFLAQANISEGFVTLMRHEQARATVQPGESTEFAWLIRPEDAAYGWMVLARVRVLRASSLPARQRACGILVLDIPVLSGNQIMGGLLAATLLYLGVGTTLWIRSERPLTKRKRERIRAIGLFALLLLLTMTISLIGWWGGGIIILLGMVLFLAVVIERLGGQRGM